MCGLLSNFNYCLSWTMHWHVFWKTRFPVVYDLLFVLANVAPNGSVEILNQYSYKSQSKLSPKFYSEWSSQNYCTFWNVEILNINIFFRFCQHGTQWEWKFLKANSSYKLPPKVLNLSWIFLSMVLHKTKNHLRI